MIYAWFITTSALASVIFWNPLQGLTLTADMTGASTISADVNELVWHRCTTSLEESQWVGSVVDLASTGIDADFTSGSMCTVELLLEEPLQVSGTNAHGAFTVEVVPTDILIPADPGFASVPYTVISGTVTDEVVLRVD